MEAKNLEIENRIKTITEGITGSNLVESEANAQKAVAEWNSAMAKSRSRPGNKEHRNTNHETKPYQHASRWRTKDSRKRPIGSASKDDRKGNAMVGIQSDNRKNERGSCTKTGSKHSRKDYQRLRKKRAETEHR